MRSRSLSLSFALVMALVVPTGASRVCALQAAEPEIEIFTHSGCPRCAAAERFLHQFSAAVRVILAIVACVVGVFNVKDFFAFGRGISFSIPEPAKHGLYKRARAILQAESLGGALAGVIVLALFVNTVELPCIAGLPAVYTHILTQRHLPWWGYYGYLALYNVA